MHIPTSISDFMTYDTLPYKITHFMLGNMAACFA